MTSPLEVGTVELFGVALPGMSSQHPATHPWISDSVGTSPLLVGCKLGASSSILRRDSILKNQGESLYGEKENLLQGG